MAPNLKLYTVLSYILIPIALFFAFLDIALLLSSLANASVLIMVFIIACLVIYTFASFKFLKAGIEKEIAQTAKLKDWIKVNAYVSFFLCSLFFINAISVLISSDIVLLKFIDEFLESQSSIPKELTSALMLSLLKGVSVFLLITGIVGLMHIRTSLRLLKQYAYLFE
ncbi:MAG: hypothetical protein D4R91_03075 [Sediminibacterium sp.]|nr:MAG: hypothetical protein D4R91_03075 [Sediminibacterium sp.]